MKMQNINAVRKQEGFTIIELVVVILLLGILAATALPRFLDVTTEAHDAVVDGVAAGLRSGVALYRAGTVARGNSRAGTEQANFNSVRNNASGYPGGSGLAAGAGTENGTLGLAAAAHTDCAAIYTGLLQLGAPTVTASTHATAALVIDTTDITATQLNGAATTAAQLEGFLAKNTGASICTYAYVGDPARRTATIPAITYNLTTGEVLIVAPLTIAAR